MKEKMNVKENEKVVPGQVLATGEKFIPSSMCIRIDDNIISTVVGNVTIKDNVIKVISNNNIGATKEEWFKLRGEELIDFMIEKRTEISDKILSYVEE